MDESNERRNGVNEIKQCLGFFYLRKERKMTKNKWALKIRHESNGTIETYKLCLVMKGYTQQEEIDYEETFSHVLRFAFIRLILALVASLDLELH
ncbi:Integrase, catalytic core [Gossypium australe]|uniref:Integrase, catalytic core n=1 Tax=Gossypium australe TaxID=47621 RepID=A0A5B6VBN2_9ROSI|nr:Integrase, catalytic core [Gossypium australe]